MTAMATVMLRIAGMDWFDAVNHAFSAISTGGFSTKMRASPISTTCGLSWLSSSLPSFPVCISV